MEDMAWGTTCAPRNSAKLAEAIIILLEDDSKRNQVAKTGYEYIQKFTWDRIVTQLEGILEEICREQ